MKNNVYYFYFKNSGWGITFLTALSFAVLIFARIFTDWYAGVWGKYSLGYHDKNTYAYVYLLFVALVLLCILLRAIMYSKLVSNASYNLFKDVIQNILRRPMYFFDTTESGVIMNRCTKDVSDCDQQIPSNKLIFSDYLFTYLGSLVILCISSPIHIALVVIFLFLLVGQINVYIKCSTDISRLTKVASAPILSKISEVLTGYVSIRNYGKKDFIWQQFTQNSDLVSNCDSHDRLFTMFLRVRIDYAILLIMSLSFVFITINKRFKLLFFDDPAQLGLIITYIISLINMTGTFVWSLTNFMVEMNSVERIQEYSQWTDHEASWE